jgi:hypothetical protein
MCGTQEAIDSFSVAMDETVDVLEEQRGELQATLTELFDRVSVDCIRGDGEELARKVGDLLRRIEASK